MHDEEASCFYLVIEEASCCERGPTAYGIFKTYIFHSIYQYISLFAPNCSTIKNQIKGLF